MKRQQGDTDSPSKRLKEDVSHQLPPTFNLEELASTRFKMTDSQGKRSYLKILKLEPKPPKSSSLLSRPISAILEDVEAEIRQSTIDRAVGEKKAAPPVVTMSELWVNKYRPKSFLDLIGDEVNFSW